MRWISSINRYSNVINGKKYIKLANFVWKHCIDNVAKAMVLVKYCLPVVWNKYLLIKNFDITNSFSAWKILTLSFMSVKDCASLHIFTVVLFIVCQMTRCIVLKVQFLYLRRSKCHLVLFSTRDKRIVITFHGNQRLNIGNQY